MEKVPSRWSRELLFLERERKAAEETSGMLWLGEEK